MNDTEIAWILQYLNGEPPAQGFVEARFHPQFLEQIPVEEVERVLGEMRDHGAAPWTVESFSEIATGHSLHLVVSSDEVGAWLECVVAAQPSPSGGNARIIGLLATPARRSDSGWQEPARRL